MPLKITFLGAARCVTGSRYLVEGNGTRVLVDCGLHQERPHRERDWAPFPVRPDSIDAILLTHAHLDHSGLLPKLVREGFRGPVYCTMATREIVQIILLDAASLQEEDAEFKKNRHKREGRTVAHPEIPLYTEFDARACFPQLTAVDYGQPVAIGDGFEAAFFDAGHTLGSAMVRLKVRDGGEERAIVFSGDMGRPGKPILRDPTNFREADYIVVESTYADRLHEPEEQTIAKLAEAINWTARAGGNILIPSFALERSQEVLYYLNRLLLQSAIPHLAVFLDSPMAISITELFEQHPELMDEETRALLRAGRSPFDFAGLHLVRTVDESKAINHIGGTVIIIAGSGMCTGGRIKHHLVANISRPNSSVLFVGFQANGTLGREIAGGSPEVRILGKDYPVHARIVQFTGFSGHADQNQLFDWLGRFEKAPRGVFVTHGEETVSEHFAGMVTERTGWRVSVPDYGETAELD